jgi:hypothetical protein
MLRTYVICAFLALGFYGYAQYRGWSVFGSDAQEFRRMRAGDSTYAIFGRGGGFSGGSSGHK